MTAMIIRDHLIVTFTTLVLGVGCFTASAQTAVQQCTSEECACDEAFKQNTFEALEDFLRKYPQAPDGKTACAALGLPLEADEVDIQDSGDARTTVQPSKPPYGG
jgi:hypothetical protein